MEALENAAFVSVGRACGFAGLAIFCLVFGFSYEPVFAAKAGAVLCAGLALILFLYANRAPARPYKRTELWLILEKEKRPPADIAQRVVGQVLRDTYIWFARQTSAVAAVFFVAAVMLRFFLAE